jgi:hypothetical protein
MLAGLRIIEMVGSGPGPGPIEKAARVEIGFRLVNKKKRVW